MTPDQARATLEFLKRTDLKGFEAFVMAEVLRALHELANAAPDKPRLVDDAA